MFNFYHWFVLDGPSDWVMEHPELRRLYKKMLRTVDRTSNRIDPADGAADP